MVETNKKGNERMKRTKRIETLRQQLQNAAKAQRAKPMTVPENFRIHERREGGFHIYYVDGLAWPVQKWSTLDEAKRDVEKRCGRRCEFTFDGSITWDVAGAR